MKKPLDITNFSGGFVDDPDALDLLENELSEVTNACVYKFGKIVMPGTFAAVTNPDWSTLITTVDDIEIGYGLFVFSADRDLAGVETPTDYLVLAFQGPANATAISIFESDGTAFSGNPIALEAAAGEMAKVVFYLADGALRITDANFSNSPTNKWFGFIDRTHFEGLTPGGTADTYLNWYAKDNTLAAPTRGLLTEAVSAATGGDADTLTDTGAFAGFSAAEIDGLGYIAANATEQLGVTINTRTSDDEVETDALSGGFDDDLWSGDSYSIHPAAGTGFCVGLVGATQAGTIPEATYEIASTFIYDDNQESALYEMPGTVTVGVGEDTISGFVNATSPYDPRITGGRIYIRESGSEDDWILFYDISLKDGLRRTLNEEYYDWNESIVNGLYPSIGRAVRNFNTVDTYQSLTGFDPDEAIIVDKFKTAVVVNRIAYLGNVVLDGKTHGDSVFKSYPNKFDSFSKDRKLDVAVNDGDDVVKLEAYADRLLEFKTKSLYIINISQEIEFLEDKKEFMGISQPYQSCQTEYGVAWCNNYGIYLYNGQQVIDLFIKEGVRKINLETWRTVFDSTNTAISYNPLKKQLFIFSTLSTTPITMYVFDFISFSWVKYIDRDTFGSQNLTNVLPDWNGNLITYDLTGTALHQWSDTPASDATGSFNITLRDEHFGNPSLKKSVYKVYVLYSSGGSATNVRVRYYTNGSSTAHDFTPVTNCTLSGGSAVLNSATERTVASMEPDTTTEAQNIYSFQLFLDDIATVPADFTVNKVTIIYRMMNTR